MTETTYAVLYLRPDGYWVAGEGWTDPRQAEEDAKEQIPDKPWSSKEEPTTKVVKVGSDEYKQAKALEEENTPFFLLRSRVIPQSRPGSSRRQRLTDCRGRQAKVD